MKTFLLFSVGIISALASLAAPVRVAFNILDHHGNSLSGTTVRLYKMNQLMMVEEHAPTTLKWVLEEGEHYTIEVSLDGFITKRMGITAGASNIHAQQFTLALEANTFNNKTPGAQPQALPSEVIVYESGRWNPDHNSTQSEMPLNEQDDSSPGTCRATSSTRE